MPYEIKKIKGSNLYRVSLKYNGNILSYATTLDNAHKQIEAIEKNKQLRGTGLFSWARKKAFQIQKALPPSDENARDGWADENHAILQLPNGKLGRANYMGPNTHLIERLKRGDPPRTAMDAESEAHDARYDLARSQIDIAEADKKFIEVAQRLLKTKEDTSFNINVGLRPIQAKYYAEKYKIIKPFTPINPTINSQDLTLVNNKLDELKLKGYGVRPPPEAISQLLEIEQDAMGDDDLHHYFPNAKILTYPELAQYNTIESLLPSEGSYFILLFLQEQNSGHWVLLSRNNGNIEFFCAYGSSPDQPLRWTSKQKRAFLKESTPYLNILFDKTTLPIVENKVDYQNKKNLSIATCGRHVCNRLKSILTRPPMTLDAYHKMMEKIRKEKKLTYDEIVAAAFPKML